VEEPGLATLCEDCWGVLEAEAPPRVRCGGLAVPAFDRAVAAWPYRDTLRDLIHAWKFEGHPSLGRPLAAGLARRCEEAREWGLEAVVPVPLGRRSWRVRGYDAAGSLAGRLAGDWGLPLLPALEWARERGRQSELGREGRLRNAAGAFRAGPVQGMRLLLVDDLLSSGATADDAARALKAAGATFVGVAALAHAESD
jgi:predicted amidophosphoribosyltransferase